MVLEALINPFKAEKKPWEMFFYGLIYTSVAIFLSLWIFQQYASLVMVFLTVMACVPLIYATIKLEEKKDLELESEKKILKEHSKVLFFLIMLFLGMTVAFAFWYVVLPKVTVQNLFNIQTSTIMGINNRVSGHNIRIFQTFFAILFNNIKVLTFCVLFAFIYGVGAIFILTWNASVIGTATGNFVKSVLAKYSSPTVANYFQAASLGLLRYSIHGIPEIAAYFVGGLAGGIISIAVIRHDYKTKKFEKVILDSSELIIISLIILIIAAFLEVFVTPLFF